MTFQKPCGFPKSLSLSKAMQHNCDFNTSEEVDLRQGPQCHLEWEKKKRWWKEKVQKKERSHDKTRVGKISGTLQIRKTHLITFSLLEGLLFSLSQDWGTHAAHSRCKGTASLLIYVQVTIYSAFKRTSNTYPQNIKGHLVLTFILSRVAISGVLYRARNSCVWHWLNLKPNKR